MEKLFTFAACLTMTALLNAQTTIFVKPDGMGDGTSWANACNLENAISRSLSGAETTDAEIQIWVQKGTYYPTKMLVVPVSVKIYGGFSGTEDDLSQRDFFANVTIVDGQQRIGSIFRLGASSELNGLTIQHGNANDNPHKNGGGVWAENNAVIENCKITNNSALMNGGGIYASGTLTLIGCTVENNTAAGKGTDTYGNCIDYKMIGCNFNIPGWGATLGTITWGGNENIETEILSISNNGVSQTWSGPVGTSACRERPQPNVSYYGGWPIIEVSEDGFNGGVSGNYNADCRVGSSGNTTSGDLFSWCAIARFADQLCPYPWRVPTKEDFADLDKMAKELSLIDGQSWYVVSQIIYGFYRDKWKIDLVESCYSNGSTGSMTGRTVWGGGYWSQVEEGADSAYDLNWGSGQGITNISLGNGSKDQGMLLRCVR